ncbi:MAG: PQQ-binding-like beta-propeller repeat protein [Desulfatiglans sp.]|nr:PQQ-binding-like beta-propeller repeat protein [Desulfatiglans sp.]
MIMMTAINGKKIVLCVIAVFMALVFALSANAASDWPNYLGPTNDFQPELKEFTATSAEEVWRVQLKTAMSSVTIADGLLYTMGNDGTKKDEDTARDYVYCLDAKTGKEIWKFDYPCKLDPRLHPGGPSSTPTIHEGKVYTLSKFGQIFCLDAKTGKKIWDASAEQYKPEKPWWGFSSSPTIMGDAVILNIGTKGMAFNKDTGKLLWKSDGSVVAYATPKPLPVNMFNQPAVAIFTNEGFYIVDPATGNPLATYAKSWEEKSNCNAITPYIYKGGIYLNHSVHGMARLNLKGDMLTQEWLSTDAKYPNEWYGFNPQVIYKDNIYFLSSGRVKADKGLHCVNALTGKRVWFDQDFEFGSLIGIGDKMIMLTETGELIWGNIIDTKFKESYRKKILNGLCWSLPVLIGDNLYARDAEGGVVCLKLK